MYLNITDQEAGDTGIDSCFTWSGDIGIDCCFTWSGDVKTISWQDTQGLIAALPGQVMLKQLAGRRHRER